MDIHSALQKHFGYDSFLPLQEDIVRDILDKKDAFVLMPTGGGKSLCYQLPPVVSGSLAVVISPLISLMKDQVDSLLANGIRAAFINSTLRPAQIAAIEALLMKNEIRVLYAAPERLMLARFLPFLKQLRIGLFAVDEAHCISEWGHDFRPEYRQLRTLRTEFPGVPIVALTATAEPKVREDILTQLHLRQAKVYISSFDRKNLFYVVQPKDDPYKQLSHFLATRKQSAGIIYCQSRKSVETLADKLQRDGYRARPYHAGLSDKEREQHQSMFIKDNIEIIVATIAFGMGINKPNVRFVVHYDLPRNLESYYQETGRAGRDGLASDCLLLFSYADSIKAEYFVAQKTDEQDRQIAYRKLRLIVEYCESGVCRRRVLLKYFGEEYTSDNCGKCDNCVAPKEVVDGTVAAQKLLSCVSRVGQRFGAHYVIQVLRGSEQEKIIRNRHNQLSTYGIGMEYSIGQWLTFVRELVHKGYLELGGEAFPVLKLNERSMRVLKGGEKVFLTKPAEEKVIEVSKAQEEAGYNKDVFEALRTLRKRIADAENVPPYVVFTDRTLKEMAQEIPRSLTALRGITGVGEVKLKKYGHLFLQELRAFAPERQTPAAVAPGEKAPAPGAGAARSLQPAPKPGGTRTEWTKEDQENLVLNFLAGHSPGELARMFDRKEHFITERLKKVGLIA